MEPNTQYDSQRNLMLAVGIMLVLWVVYMQFFAPTPPPVAEVQDAGVSQQVAQQPAAPSTADAGEAMAQAPEGEPPPPVSSLKLGTDLLAMELSSEGAGLTSATLLGQKMREQNQLTIGEGYKRLFGGEVEDAPQIDMGRPHPDRPLPLGLSIQGARPFAANARYKVEEDAAARTVKFTARQGNTEVIKVLQLPEKGFEAAMAITVRNLGGEALGGDLVMHYTRAVEPGTEEKASFFGGVGNESFAACYVDDELHKRVPDDEEEIPEHAGKLSFFGIDQQYFLAAIFPLEGATSARCRLLAAPDYRSTEAAFPLNVPAGGETTLRYGVYIGPKDQDLLTAVPARMKDLGLVQAAETSGTWASGFQGSRYPHLERSVDLGIWAAIAKLLIWVMRFFHNLFGNWGVAIILLTVTVKLILLPLTHKSMVSAEQMKKLQPRMEEIRKKFAEDKNRQNVEMMKLYQEAKVNPLGGCLPMLVQMPVWIALFTALRNSYEIYREPFISPVWTDLTYKDPTYLLPLALGVTMIITQKLQPQMMDATQAKIMTWVMPIFFTGIMLGYPAGLSLYIFTNNVLSIVQQYALRKYLEKKGLAAPPPPPKSGGKGGGLKPASQS